MTTANEKLMAMIASKKQSMKKVVKPMKLLTGDNRIRLLPGWRSIDKTTGTVDVNADPTFFHDFGQHFVKNAAKELKAIYICTTQTFGTPCEVCDSLAQAVKVAGDDATIKTIEEAKSRKSFLLNVQMLDSTEPNRPQILEVGFGIMSDLLNLLGETESAPLNVINGNVIKINRDGTGLNTKYTVGLALKNPTTMLTTDVSAASLKLINDLDEYVKQESVERQRLAVAAVGGLVGFTPVATGDDVPAQLRALAPPASSASSSASSHAHAAESTPDTSYGLDAELDDILAGM